MMALATKAAEPIPPALVRLLLPKVTAKFARAPATVVADDESPNVRAAPSSPPAWASAFSPIATAMLVSVLVHCPPEPRPKRVKN